MNELKNLAIQNESAFLSNMSWYTTTVNDGHWSVLTPEWPDLKRVLETHAVERRTIISAGGHIGLYACGYAELFKTVYVFEPDPLHFYCLVNNVQFPNVVKIQCAVGEKASAGAMVGNGMGARVDFSGENLYIPIVPIDAFQFPTVDVIQLDVEGYELQALKGAIDTILTHHPLLIIENGQQQNFVDFLSPLGYTIIEQMHWDTVWSWGRYIADEPKI